MESFGATRGIGRPAAAGLAILFLLFAYRSILTFPRGIPLVGGTCETVRQIFPVYEQIHRAGGPVLFDPHYFGGYPLYANSNLAPLYPPVLLLAGPFPPETSLWLLFALHGVWGFCGALALLRRWGCCREIALGGAGIYLFLGCSYFAMFSYPLAWWPWIILCFHLLLVGEGQRGLPLVGGAVSLAAMAVSGHPQIVAFCLVSSFAVTGLEWLTGLASGWRRDGPGFACGRAARNLLLAGCAFALGLGMAAYQLLPLLEFSGESHRTGMLSAYFSTKSSIFVSGEIEHGLRTFFGAWPQASLLVWPAALLSLAWVGRRGRIAALWAVGLLCFLYALGDVTPVVNLVQMILPPLKKFRNPHLMSLMGQILLLLVGCLGAQALTEESRSPVRRAGVALMALPAALCLVGWTMLTYAEGVALAAARLLYGLLSRGASFAEREPDIRYALSVMRDGLGYGAAVLAASLAAAAAVWLAARNLRAAAWLQLGLAAALAAGFSVQFAARDRLLPENALVRFLKSRPGVFRVLNMKVERTRILEQPMAVAHELCLADGMDGLVESSYWESWLQALPENRRAGVYPSTKLPICSLSPNEIADMELLRRWNVGYILSTVRAYRPDLREVAHFTDLPTYRFPEGIGKYEEVYVYELSPPCRERLRFFDKNGAERPEVLTLAPEGAGLRADVNSPVGGTAVCAVQNFSGWRVFVDGAEAKKLARDGQMPAAEIPPGRHRVEFAVMPGSLYTGLAATGVAFCAALAVLVAALVAARGRS